MVCMPFAVNEDAKIMRLQVCLWWRVVSHLLVPAVPG